MQKRSIAAAVVIASLLASCDEDFEAVTPPAPFHGVHGLAFDAEGRLLAGSVLGAAIYEVDTNRAVARTYIGSPQGMADDIALAPNGALAWTAFLDGKVWLREPNGEIRLVAEGLPGANSLAFNAQGRLFFTQVFLGDALYEADVSGKNPPRKIMENMGGLNGFEFGPDGFLYGPLWFKKTVVRVDADRGRIDKTIARGFGIPAAVNFGPDGRLYAVDTERGEVVRIDVQSGEKKTIARVKPAIDNLAFSPQGKLFISNMADNAIIEIDLKTGEAHTRIEGALAVAADIAVAGRNDDEAVYVADVFAIRKINPKTGDVQEIARMFGDKMDYPLHISAAADHIVLTGWSAGSLQVISRQSGESLSLQHGFSTPHDAVMLPDKSIVLAEYAKNRLLHLRGRNWNRQSVYAADLSGPAALALGPDGRLYVAENTTGQIVAIDPQSRRRRLVAQGLAGPEGFDFLPDGSIVLAETGRQRLVRISPAGTITPLAENLPFGVPAPGGAIPTGIPTGVAVGQDGSIYFSSEENAAVYRLRP